MANDIAEVLFWVMRNKEQSFDIERFKKLTQASVIHVIGASNGEEESTDILKKAKQSNDTMRLRIAQSEGGVH